MRDSTRNNVGQQFRCMTEQNLGQAVDVFARAFFDDPITHYLFPDKNERFRQLKSVFKPYLRYGVLFGEVHTRPGDVEAGAMWLGPDEWHMTDEGSEVAGFGALPEALGEEAFERFDKYFTWMNGLHDLDGPARHLYLAVLAVDTHLQGQGIGSALVRNVTRRADMEGLPCYLETQQPRNVPLYQRLGFEVIVDTVEPVSGVRTWTFLRQPQTAP